MSADALDIAMAGNASKTVLCTVASAVGWAMHSCLHEQEAKGEFYKQHKVTIDQRLHEYSCLATSESCKHMSRFEAGTCMHSRA